MLHPPGGGSVGPGWRTGMRECGHTAGIGSSEERYKRTAVKAFLPSSSQLQTCGYSECAKEDASNEVQNPFEQASGVHRWSASDASSEKNIGCPRRYENSNRIPEDVGRFHKL